MTLRRGEPLPVFLDDVVRLRKPHPCGSFEWTVVRLGADIGLRRPYPIDSELTGFMQIIVRDNNVDQALRALKKKLQREGVYREMKLRRHYEKPSEKRARERAAAIRRARKLERKRMERDGAK